MIGVLPSVSQTDLQGVMGLISFLADPKACKKRLEELNAIASDLQDKSDSVNIAKNEIDALKKDLESQKKVVDGDASSAASLKRTLQESVDAHKAKVQDFNSQLKLSLDDVLAKTLALDSREKALSSREASVANLENEVKINLKAANDTKIELNNKLAQLKAIAS